MTLYIVATPIGNLEDITLRALRILKEADSIVCEDTRHSRKLLTHYQIHTPLVSFYEPKEKEQIPYLLGLLKEGKKLALITDSGTPGISDPGFRLIRKAIEEGISVVPIPGPCAALCALQASGLPTDHFFFVGFLPEKKGKRGKYIESLKNLGHTCILYLSPWKAVDQVEELASVLGGRSVCLARELTKIHEEFWRGPLMELARRLGEKPPKGEITLVIEGEK